MLPELLLTNDGYFPIEFLQDHSEIENASKDQIKKLCIYNQSIEGDMDICKKCLTRYFGIVSQDNNIYFYTTFIFLFIVIIL